MTKARRGSFATISAELLLSTALLFGAALLVAVLAALLVLPNLATPATATLFVGLILLADLTILFLFLRSLLARNIFRPLRTIGENAERIAAGAYEHRIPRTGREELDRLVTSVNTMARRLIRDQRLLEENVRSLDRTNRELVDTTDELIRTARMASVGTLAGGIAHEVGNPLGALRASLDVARRRADSGGDVGEALEAAREEAVRIDAIVRSILEFVRADEGAREWTRVRVADEARGAVALLERRGALEGLRVRVREKGGDVPPVLARAQLLEQVLVNLVMNAAQASGTGGGAGGNRDAPEIEIVIRGDTPAGAPFPRRRAGDPPGADYSHRRRLARLREGAPATGIFRRGADAVVEIMDRGPGIDQENLLRVFDPFFTTRAPGEGTGMGLAITARIVHELGGEIEAENRPRGGALVRIRLPGAPAARSAKAGAARPGIDERDEGGPGSLVGSATGAKEARVIQETTGHGRR
jgi:two-component system, NtrC family, sensor kinase